MTSDRKDRLAQLERILHSRTLQGSESLKSLLEYVVRKSLENQNGELKEYTIASEVFGNSKYDPRIDSTVRVQAARLRSKLEEYYATEGKEDRILIELPKGHYIPLFSFNPKSRHHPDEAPHLPAEPSGESSGTPRPGLTADKPAVPVRGRMRAATWLLLLLVLALAFLAVNYRVQLNHYLEHHAGASGDPGELQTLAGLWGDFLQSSRPVLVVYSNALFQRTPDGRLTPVDPSVERRALPVADPIGSRVGGQTGFIDTIDHYTGVGEVMGVASLSTYFSKAGHNFRVKRGQLLAWDDVKTENIVVLGSPHENHFLRDLPQQLGFVFRFNPADNSLYVVNLQPKPGQGELYHPKFDRPANSASRIMSVVEDYAVISLLRGLGESNRLMILAGTTTFATQAATEYVTDAENIRDLQKRLGGSGPFSSSLPASFQVLLKVKVNGGVPVQTAYVTHHILD
jgi:hypothetical protein